MRLDLVRHGDPTTTRGFVIAYSSTMHDDGKKIALFGDTATCGNCEGAYPIYATGEGVSEKGRVAVVHGDKVLCPCGKNRVIAGSDAGCHLERQRDLSATGTTGLGGAAISSSSNAIFDEQIRVSATATALDGYPYFIETQEGQTYSGRINAGGTLPRISTEAIGEYSVHWGDDALARWECST
jgi:uncharacterized Zn-binding protein involved in type VI secretion